MPDPRKTKSVVWSEYPLLASATVFLVVYVILFEFVLHENEVLPKPSLLLESFPALIYDYNLLGEIALTTTIIYMSIFLAYILIYFIAPVLINISLNYDGLFNGLRIFRYFPAFFYAILFAFWFPFSIVAEFFFAFIACLFFLGLMIFQNLDKTKQEYVVVALNLGVPEKQIYKDVVWKCTQPELFHSMKKLHYYLWVLLLIYEYIGSNAGLGFLYSVLLEYHDFASLFAVAITISFLIWLGNILLKYFDNKLIYWEP
jgi:ABC-type nitrate/sulfonate/bicarbonate transport system permease component